MGAGIDWISAFAQLGFPVAVAVYLLVVQSRQTERLIRAQSEMRIGMYLILARLDIIDDYEKAVAESRKKKEEEC